MFNLRNNKLGMTLIEMVISLVVLSILTTSTMGIIISSNNIFISTSNAALDRQVGGHVFETLTSILKYSTHLSIYDADKAPTDGVSQCISLDITDDDTQSGVLMFKHKDADDVVNLYNDGFYGRRTVQYTLEEAGTSHKHIKLTVRVFRDGKMRYELSRVIKCVNLALISTGVDANFIKDMSTPGSTNQYISFSVDEQLISGGKDAFSLEYKISEYMAKYNRIQLEYTSKLLAVYGEINSKIGNTENKEGKRVPKSEYEEMLTFQETAIYGTGTPKWEVENVREYASLQKHYQDEIKALLKFTPTLAIKDSTGRNPFYGVVATKEELYTGFLLTYFDTDKNSKGKITKNEYPQFTDAKSFFQGTSIANYISNTSSKSDANQMVIMSYFKDNIAEDFSKLFDSHEKVVYTYSGTKEDGYSHAFWYSTENIPGKNLDDVTLKEGESKPASKTMPQAHGITDHDVMTYFTIDTNKYAGIGAESITDRGDYEVCYKLTQAANTYTFNMPKYERHNDWSSIVTYQYAWKNAPSGTSKGSDIIGSLTKNATELKKDSNCAVYEGHPYGSNGNNVFYVYPYTDLAQGWYYFKDSGWYHFVYLSADETCNTSKVAVKAQPKMDTYTDKKCSGGARIVFEMNGTSCREQTIKDWAFAQAKYDKMEQGANDEGKAYFDTVAAHQYTDYILYGVDWNSWFKSSPDGLLNKVMTGVISFVESIFGQNVNKDITFINGDNANYSLGNRGKYTTNNFDGDIASYNLAWTVYNPKRGTWYYLPSSSTRLSNLTSELKISSNKDQPIPLDVDMKNGKTWASSSAMVSDIDSRKLSSSGLFGIVDTTKDVLWVGLPTGNQLEVKFTEPTTE